MGFTVSVVCLDPDPQRFICEIPAVMIVLAPNRHLSPAPSCAPETIDKQVCFIYGLNLVGTGHFDLGHLLSE